MTANEITPSKATTRTGLRARFAADRRGATAVQAIVMLPAILFFFAAGVTLWQTVNVRKSLNNGTYEAVRWLSLYPPRDTSPYAWEEIAREMITTELRSNPWVKQPVTDADLTVTVTIYDGNECEDKFRLEAAYNLFAPVGARDPGSPQGLLPNMAPIQLKEDREGVVVCD